MKGISIFPRGEVDDLESRRTVSEALGEVYFEEFWEPGDGTYLSCTPSAAENLGHLEFPDALTSSWKKSWKLRSRWNRCGIYAKLWYTSPAGSTNTFNITFGGRQLSAGGNLGTPAVTFTATASIAGPAVARDVKTWEYVNNGALLAGFYDLLSLRINRDGAVDANNGALWVLGLYVKLTESAS